MPFKFTTIPYLTGYLLSGFYLPFASLASPLFLSLSTFFLLYPSSMATSESAKSPSLPFKTRIQLAILNLVADGVRRNDGTVNRRVMNLLDRRIPPNPNPDRGVSSYDVTVDPISKLWFRLYLPHHDGAASASPPPSLPVIIFFHGGGFVFLSASSYAYDAVCRRFARKLNAVVLSVDYRLAPEYKFPSQYDDGFDVLKFINDHRQKITSWPENADVSRCFLSGDSAGGNLVHHLAVKSCEAKLSDVRIIGLINIQPFFGGKERADSEFKFEGMPIVSMARTEWMWKAFLPDGLDPDHWSVNVSGTNALDISGLDNFPGTVLFIGGFDPLQDWQRKYYEWLKNSGKEVKLVEYPTAIHAFYVFPELPETSLLFAEVKAFIEKQSSSKVR